MEFGTNKLLKQGAIAIENARDIIGNFNLEYKEQPFISNTVTANTIPEKYKEIYKLLEKKSMDINEISRKSCRPINEINSLLFMMELEEYIEKKNDGTYAPKEGKLCMKDTKLESGEKT